MNKSKIVTVYSGKPGCMCGCRGKYSENQAQITRVYNILIENMKDVVVDEDNAYLLLENKLYVAYFNK